MYFRFQQKSKLLTVNDNYAHLVSITDGGDLVFEFTYSLSQRDAVNFQAMKLKIDVDSRNVAKKPILGQTHRGHVDTKAIVDNVRTAIVDAKSTLLQRQRWLVASRLSDITALINNDILPQLRARVPVSSIPHFNRPRLALSSVNSIKENNDPQPILQRISNSSAVPDIQHVLSASAGENPQSLMHDMITRQGIDPSHILALAPRVSSEHSTHNGLSSPQRATERTWDPAVRLLHRHLFPPSFTGFPNTTEDLVDTDMVQVLKTVTDDSVEVTETITLPAGKMRQEGVAVTQLYVKFDLLDSKSNLPVDSITKVLDVTQHVHVYYTPKNPPIVKAAASEISTRINLEIKQIDPGATEVQVLKKSFWVASPEVDTYSVVGNYALTAHDQSLLIQVDQPQKSPVIYRVIPRGKQSTQGFEFTNVAVRPSRYVPVRAVSLTGHQVDTGVQLEVRRIPTNVVAVQFMRWNLTTFDSSPTTVGTDVGFIDNSVRLADLLSTVDTAVTINNVYRYLARLIYVDGHTADFGNATVEFIKPSPGEVDTRIDSLIVDHDAEPNVTFTITTSVVDTDIDALNRMLENQGIKNFFTDDIRAQRDQLQDLIAHSVHRVDLNTGQRDNFGILTNPAFNDSALRKNQAIKPLEYGHRYRYEVYPLLRAPETLFDGFRKDAVDEVTKKPYTFSPAKFLHPYALKRGVLVSTAGARLRHAKDPMAYGVIGSIATTEVSFDDDTASVSEAVASNFDRYFNVVSWKVLGTLDKVDHFLILKQVHGIRTILGKTHSEFANGACQYIHRITQHDTGALQYIIVPVYSDYRLGAEANTNTLLVEAP